jgi:GNAT superfamily N-acetyltransferase
VRAPADVVGVREAWAQLAGVERLDGIQVIVRPESALSVPGWCGFLSLDGTLTAVVPDDFHLGIVSAALVGLSATEATTPEIIVPRFSEVAEVLGPAALFYPTASVQDGWGRYEVDQETVDQLDGLLREVSPEDVAESGLDEITGPVFLIRQGDEVAAACGWQEWQARIAHLCILTRPAYRQRGLAAAVAAAALRAAVSEGLLPQWRARPIASQRLARSLGLVQLGAQLSLQLS